jgi:hypothetical protein
MRVIKLFQCGGASSENSLVKIQVLKRNLVRTPTLRTPLNIRDALYGGRTEATKTYYKVKQGGK